MTSGRGNVSICRFRVISVLEALAASPPRFRLPFAVASHTRAYLSANGKDPTAKNLVFDPFLVFDRPHACFLPWPQLDLSPQDRSTLRPLLENLNFLGRSESWVNAEIWDGPLEAPLEAVVADTVDKDCDLQKVACAVSATDYTGKQPWIDALTYSTADMLKQRTSSPPLLRQIPYSLPKNAIAVNPQRRPRPRAVAVQAVRLGLDARYSRWSLLRLRLLNKCA